jgi:hypothetical protein
VHELYGITLTRERLANIPLASDHIEMPVCDYVRFQRNGFVHRADIGKELAVAFAAH